jgi:tRNA(Ile)-lysidine synthase
MARFAPFERAPTIAVGVSGGRDSMSLALLASRWTARCGGALIAITVDHGLRPDSASEARQAGDWLKAHGIRHLVLRWPGPYPATGVQAAARQARYRLLTDYCREHAILHLLVAHHRGDQGETVWLRGERASGSHGLAAMAAVSEHRHLRLLRPLLDVPRERLAATLDAVGQTWIDDPSNDDTAMARGRLRSQGGQRSLADALATARACADERVSAERAAAALAARALRFDPAGFITIDRETLTVGTPDIVERVLARAVMAVAGRIYPPRGERTRRLREAMANSGEFRSRTLGGCRLIGQENLIHVCREPARIGPPTPLKAGATAVWDNRFLVSVTKSLGKESRLEALTASGWEQIVGLDPQLRTCAMPYAARVALPAVWRGDRVMAVSHLGYVDHREPLFTAGLRLRWRPPLAVAPAQFGKV